MYYAGFLLAWVLTAESGLLLCMRCGKWHNKVVYGHSLYWIIDLKDRIMTGIVIDQALILT